jgi:hypothetical protein
MGQRDSVEATDPMPVLKQMMLARRLLCPVERSETSRRALDPSLRS